MKLNIDKNTCKTQTLEISNRGQGGLTCPKYTVTGPSALCSTPILVKPWSNQTSEVNHPTKTKDHIQICMKSHICSLITNFPKSFLCPWGSRTVGHIPACQQAWSKVTNLAHIDKTICVRWYFSAMKSNDSLVVRVEAWIWALLTDSSSEMSSILIHAMSSVFWHQGTIITLPKWHTQHHSLLTPYHAHKFPVGCVLDHDKEGWKEIWTSMTLFISLLKTPLK